MHKAGLLTPPRRSGRYSSRMMAEIKAADKDMTTVFGDVCF
jgi:hypothetical protein